MTFDDSNKAIYLQIVDILCDAILRGEYNENDRLPSVREFAASVEVNANTVMRSYDKLSTQEIISNKRGIGFFVATGAKTKILQERKISLFEQQLPPLFNQLTLLGISPDDLKDAFEKFLNKNY